MARHYESSIAPPMQRLNHTPRGATRGITRRWLPLVFVLLLCLPPLLISLGSRDTTHTMENVALVVSQETWLRMHAQSDYDWYLSYNDTIPRIAKPPMVTWQQMLAWTGLDPETATADTLIYRARLMAVCMGLLTLIAIYWAGLTLDDVALAASAALAAGATVFFQRQARTASYDIHFVAFATLSIAAGLWAIGPKETALATSRIITGWAVSGVALAAAALSKNPLAYPVVLGPLVLAIAISPRRKIASVAGLLGAVAISLAAVVPWYVTIHNTVKNADDRLRVEFEAMRDSSQPFYYYLGIFALVAPWSVWMIAAVAHPFMDGKRIGFRTRLLPWLWLLVIFIMFSIHPTKQQRYILPIIPAVALLLAFVWRDHDSMLRKGRTPDGYSGWVNVHGISMLLVSLFYGPFLTLQNWLVQYTAKQDVAQQLEALHEPAVGSVTWPAAIIITVVLTVLALMTWRIHRRGKPLAAFALTGIWGIVLMTVFWQCYSRAASGDHPVKPVAFELRQEVGDAPLRSLRISGVDRAFILNEEFRIYFGRLIPWVRLDELTDFARQTSGTGYVLARQTDEHNTALTTAGYVPLHEVVVDKRDTEMLWRTPVNP